MHQNDVLHSVSPKCDHDPYSFYGQRGRIESRFSKQVTKDPNLDTKKFRH